MAAAARRRLLAVFAALLALLAAAEVSLRAIGMHRPVLYQATAYGYRVAPDQDLRRFGNRIRYNAQGLRNDPMAPQPAPEVTRILCLGDSVTNGGATTDQALTFPALLQATLRRGGRKAEVLNASAPGWATANALGWLRENGTQGSSTVLLTLSTHDLFQGMAPSDVVDHHHAFPSRAPVLALQDLFTHYIAPRLGSRFGFEDPGVGDVTASPAAVARALDNVLAMAELARSRSARLAVLFIEQETDAASDAVTLAAKEALRARLAERGIPLLSLSDSIERLGRAALFRDGVHPSELGNRVIAERLAARLQAQARSGR